MPLQATHLAYSSNHKERYRRRVRFCASSSLFSSPDPNVCSRVPVPARRRDAVTDVYVLPPQPDKLKLIGEYKAKIEKELETICGDILTIIDDNLLPNSQSNESKVFYYKMQGEETRPPPPPLLKLGFRSPRAKNTTCNAAPSPVPRSLSFSLCFTVCSAFPAQPPTPPLPPR